MLPSMHTYLQNLPLCDSVKDFERVRLAWIIRVDPKYSGMNASGREVEGDLTTDRRGRGHVTTKAEMAAKRSRAKGRPGTD